MNNYFISTVGTSIANDIALSDEFRDEKNLNMPYNSQDFAQSWAASIRESVDSKIAALKEGKSPMTLCAECNVMGEIGLRHGDKVLLLAGDNLQGRLCGEAVKALLLRFTELESQDITVDRIEGLQVSDAKKMREEGLNNLCQSVIDAISANRYQYNMYLNPTGGFKGVVPFLTILGMLFSCRLIYKFQYSSELIMLPSLPLRFDRAMLQRAAKAIEYAYLHDFVSEDDFLHRIEDYSEDERNEYMGMLQGYNGVYQVSPLVMQLLERNEVPEPIKVSTVVRETLEKSDATARMLLERMLNNSTKPSWRATHFHQFHETDLLVFQRGKGAAVERMAGYMEDGTLHVAYVYAVHDAYTDDLPTRTVARAKKLQYDDWYLPMGNDEVDKRERHINRLQAELDEANKKIRELEGNIDKKVEERAQKLEKKYGSDLRHAQTGSKLWQSRADNCRTALDKLMKEVSRYQHLIRPSVKAVLKENEAYTKPGWPS